MKAFFFGSVSSDYVSVDSNKLIAVADRLSDAWKNESLPEKQRLLVEKQIARYRKGEAVPVFDVLIHAIDQLEKKSPFVNLLEIGCSSGYYSQVIQIAGKSIQYSGADYSPTFIKLAKTSYPEIDFEIQDATELTYKNGQFDLVISGCCLLHISDYELAIREAARVAKKSVIFHRTPVRLSGPTKYYTKLAYGVETLEIHISENEFLMLCKKHGLAYVNQLSLSQDDEKAERTYLFNKVREC